MSAPVPDAPALTPLRRSIEQGTGRIDIDDHVVLDESLRRPAEVERLVGDASKANRVLGWEPRVSFYEMIRLMVDADSDRLSRCGQCEGAQRVGVRSAAMPPADQR